MFSIFRKRSRDEDTCDFMPISKRINNLTLTSQSLGEQELSTIHNVNSNVGTNHHLMAINNQEIQSQHFAQHTLNSYPNEMSQHYLNHQGQPSHNGNYHQSHIVQSTNHSNGFHNDSHLSLGTNIHKSNHPHHHHPAQLPQQLHPQVHQQANDDLSNNQMEEVYCPELKADENPFYYNKNKLLFDLHAERQRRHQSHQ